MPYFEPQNVKKMPGKYTIDQLFSVAPAGPDTLGYYATVTDLFGVKEDLVLCSKFVNGGNTSYFWQPVRPEFAASMSADQNSSLIPLKTPSILFLTGAILAGVGRTFNLDSVYAFPGASFEIAFDGTLGLGSILNVGGLVGGSTVSMVLNGRKRFFYDGTVGGWKTFQ